MQVSQPGLGSGSVDLTHVLALVWPLHVSDVQVPHAVTIMTHPYPGVPRDHVVLHGEDGAPVIVYPGNLSKHLSFLVVIIRVCTKKLLVSNCLSHCLIFAKLDFKRHVHVSLLFVYMSYKTLWRTKWDSETLLFIIITLWEPSLTTEQDNTTSLPSGTVTFFTPPIKSGPKPPPACSTWLPSTNMNHKIMRTRWKHSKFFH